MRLVPAWLFIGVWAILASPAWARVNVLSPWAPGVDFFLPRQRGHEVDLRVGRDAHDVNLLEFSYQVISPVSPNWVLGVQLNFMNLDSSSPFQDDAGLGDMALALQASPPKGFFPKEVESLGEVALLLPTGDPHHGLGAGGPGIKCGGALGLPLGEMKGYLRLGLESYLAGQGTRWASAFSYVVGASAPSWRGYIFSADLRGRSRGADKISGVVQTDAKELYVALGAERKLKKSPATLLGNLLLGFGPDDYQAGILLGLKL